MTEEIVTFRNGPIFDGERLHAGHAIRFVDGRVAARGPEDEIAPEGRVVDLAGDMLAPGYVDLQVNGGGGVMFGDEPSVETLRRISRAHRGLGVAAFLPTLVTDTPEKTRAAIAATARAVREGVPGVAGLHLEGPHLSPARKGAHDGSLIRAMTPADLAEILAAAAELPVLKVTVAPESVTEEQVAALARAGAVVALGHTDASYDVCRRYFAAGARCATHLFNAMSQLGSREPGLVGAALEEGRVAAGLIADGVHVHAATMRAAWAAKAPPGGIFLVSDAMAVAGTDLAGFDLGGRAVTRQGGALRLADGTLAGADLDLTTAIRNTARQAGVPLEAALRAATRVPAALIGREWRLERLDGAIRIAGDLGGLVPLLPG